MNCIIGKKIGMTRLFDEKGGQVAVTAIEVGPCVVTQRKTAEKDGVDAVQLGYGEAKEHRLTKPEAGHFKKAGVSPLKMLKDVRISADEELKAGDTITSSIFEGASHVDVIGLTKGRGFQGVMKRHNMAGGRMSHGSHTHREVGSIGQCTRPSRVFKNKKMPGQMGNKRITVQNLRIERHMAEDNVLLVRGAVPGPTGAIVMVRRALKKSAGKAS